MELGSLSLLTLLCLLALISKCGSDQLLHVALIQRDFMVHGVCSGITAADW